MADKTNLHLNRCVARVCYKSARQLHIDNMCVGHDSCCVSDTYRRDRSNISPVSGRRGAKRRSGFCLCKIIRCFVAEYVCMAVCGCVRTCDHVTRCRDGDWWYAEHLSNGRRGYIPVNYIAEVNSIRRFECVNILRHYNHNYAPTLCRISCRNSEPLRSSELRA